MLHHSYSFFSLGSSADRSLSYLLKRWGLQARLLPLSKEDKHVVIDGLSESKLDTDNSIILWEMTVSRQTTGNTTE